MQYEIEKIPIWYAGEWVSEDGKILNISFSEPQNMSIESPQLPEFERDGFWGPSEIPTAFRFRSIQINCEVTETEALWMGVSKGRLQIHSYTSYDPTADLFKPVAPKAFNTVAFTRKSETNTE